MSRRARTYSTATAAKRGDLLAQDISPELSLWLAGQPDARLRAREAAQDIADDADSEQQDEADE